MSKKKEQDKYPKRRMNWKEWQEFWSWASTISFLAKNLIYQRTKDAKKAYRDEGGNFIYEDDPDFEKNVRHLKRDARWKNKSFRIICPEKEAYSTTKEYRELKTLSVLHQNLILHPQKLAYWDKTFKGAVETYWYIAQVNYNISRDTINMIQKEDERFTDEAKQAGQHRREQKAAIREKFDKIGG